jgi:hypothetical protein
MTLFANVNVGAAPNDGTGDSLRQSFITINNNFSYINQTIWHDLSQAELTANLTSSYISRFNLVQAVTVQSPSFGNTGAVYYGNVFSSANGFQGPLGAYGANTAVVSTLTVNSNASVTGNLITLDYIVKGVTNSLDTNLSTTSISLSPTSSKQWVAVALNANATLSYSNITAGCDRVYVLRNPTLTAYYITLPNNFNNKNATSFLVDGGYNALLHFIPFDNTSGNVFVEITNS